MKKVFAMICCVALMACGNNGIKVEGDFSALDGVEAGAQVSLAIMGDDENEVSAVVEWSCSSHRCRSACCPQRR